MKRSMCAAAFAVLAFAGTSVFAQADMKPPVAKKEPKVLKIHGYEITDNYAWMRDRNEKKDPEIIKYLEAENAYTEEHMGQHNHWQPQEPGERERMPDEQAPDQQENDTHGEMKTVRPDVGQGQNLQGEDDLFDEVRIADDELRRG